MFFAQLVFSNSKDFPYQGLCPRQVLALYAEIHS